MYDRKIKPAVTVEPSACEAEYLHAVVTMRAEFNLAECHDIDPDKAGHRPLSFFIGPVSVISDGEFWYCANDGEEKDNSGTRHKTLENALAQVISTLTLPPKARTLRPLPPGM